MDDRLDVLRDSYDTVADEYVERLFGELEHKPLDRELLDRFAARLRGAGPVCDLGCGPGHVTRYLADRGVDVFGLDLSPRMVEHARRLTPGVEFREGDMLRLDAEDGAWAGIVAFYSIVHLPRERVAAAFEEMRRVLRPGGLLLVAFHAGSEVLHRDELWGREVSLDFYFFEREEVEGYLRSAGFEVEEAVERPPYEEVEYPSRRVYVFARRPERA